MIYASSKDAIKKKLTGKGYHAPLHPPWLRVNNLGQPPTPSLSCPLGSILYPSICSDGSFSAMEIPYLRLLLTPLLFPTGIKHELQANCYEEVKDRCTLAEKLGGSAVISLEGKPL